MSTSPEIRKIRLQIVTSADGAASPFIWLMSCCVATSSSSPAATPSMVSVMRSVAGMMAV